MRLARRPATLAVLGALVVLLAMPAVALAADPVTVTGTVVRDGAPVVAVEVVVSVSGTDVIASTATDEQGAFSVEVEAEVGSELEVFATGQTSRTGPDDEGCVRTETPIGDTTSVIETLPPAPITVELDTVLTSDRVHGDRDARQARGHAAVDGWVDRRSAVGRHRGRWPAAGPRRAGARRGFGRAGPPARLIASRPRPRRSRSRPGSPAAPRGRRPAPRGGPVGRLRSRRGRSPRGARPGSRSPPRRLR